MLSISTDRLSVALFRAFASGEASASALDSALFAELAAHCPTCRATLEAFVVAEGEREVQGAGGRVLSFASGGMEVREPPFDCGELEELSPAERVQRVRRSRKRYSGNDAARCFLGRARHSLPSEPHASRHWAELALAALQGRAVTSPREFLESATLDVRAWGFVANAERIAGNLAEAEGIFERLSDFVRAVGVSDLRALAELQSFGASLRVAQRRLNEAEALFLCAAELYGVVGERTARTSNLSAKALAALHAGEPQRAFSELTALWAEVSEPRPRLEIRHNQIFALLECDEATSAAMLLDESLPLYEQFPDSWTQSRLAAINGKVLHALDVREPAERNYRLAREGFLSSGEPYTAAVISLDLAVLLLEAQRYSEVGELALDMLATFQKVGVQGEALAAWQLFVDAAQRQEASVMLARRLGRYLEQVRQDPSLQFAAD